jgi:hypothetical protein
VAQIRGPYTPHKWRFQMLFGKYLIVSKESSEAEPVLEATETAPSEAETQDGGGWSTAAKIAIGFLGGGLAVGLAVLVWPVAPVAVPALLGPVTPVMARLAGKTLRQWQLQQ